MASIEHPIHSADIYKDIRGKLIAASFAPGEKMKPERLRASYKCAASTLREVLFRLASDGFLTFEEQRGFRVVKCTPESLRELTQMRTLLETEGARLSMEHGGVEWEAKLSAAHHKLAHIEQKMSAAEDPDMLLDVWCAAEWEFHETLLTACGSELLREQHRNIYDRFRQHLLTQKKQFGFRDSNHVEHKAIVDAALARDEDLCRKSITAHLMANLS